jgi:hypothetical protein
MKKTWFGIDWFKKSSRPMIVISRLTAVPLDRLEGSSLLIQAQIPASRPPPVRRHAIYPAVLIDGNLSSRAHHETCR